MNLIFRCLTVLLTLIGNEAVFAFSGIGNTLDFGELAAFPGAEGYGRMTTGGRGGEKQILHISIFTFIYFCTEELTLNVSTESKQ